MSDSQYILVDGRKQLHHHGDRPSRARAGCQAPAVGGHAAPPAPPAVAEAISDAYGRLGGDAVELIVGGEAADDPAPGPATAQDGRPSQHERGARRRDRSAEPGRPRGQATQLILDKKGNGLIHLTRSNSATFVRGGTYLVEAKNLRVLVRLL
jgi:hypothetical protein